MGQTNDRIRVGGRYISNDRYGDTIIRVIGKSDLPGYYRVSVVEQGGVPASAFERKQVTLWHERVIGQPAARAALEVNDGR